MRTSEPCCLPSKRPAKTPHGDALKALQPGQWMRAQIGPDGKEATRFRMMSLARHYGFRVKTWTAHDGTLIVQRRDSDAS